TPSPTSEPYTLSLHDALPIFHGRSAQGDGRPAARLVAGRLARPDAAGPLRTAQRGRLGGRAVVAEHEHGAGALRPDRALPAAQRSEEHTSELQSRFDLVCRLL